MVEMYQWSRGCETRSGMYTNLVSPMVRDLGATRMTACSQFYCENLGLDLMVIF